MPLYPAGMTTGTVLLIALVVVVVATITALFVGRRRRSRRPLTREQRLAAAARAVRELRRSSLRPHHRDPSERGCGLPDRYSGAAVENAAFGDAAGGGGGSGGD